jgi:hypothetical protein
LRLIEVIFQKIRANPHPKKEVPTARLPKDSGGKSLTTIYLKSEESKAGNHIFRASSGDNYIVSKDGYHLTTHFAIFTDREADSEKDNRLKLKCEPVSHGAELFKLNPLPFDASHRGAEAIEFSIP